MVTENWACQKIGPQLPIRVIRRVSRSLGECKEGVEVGYA